MLRLSSVKDLENGAYRIAFGVLGEATGVEHTLPLDLMRGPHATENENDAALRTKMGRKGFTLFVKLINIRFLKSSFEFFVSIRRELASLKL